jgi:hypothetical protein
MNKTIYIAMLALLAFTLNACKKEYEEIGLPASKIEGLKSKWVLSTFNVTDKGGIIEDKLDMTDYFDPSFLPNITFSILDADTTFTSDTTGIPMNVFSIPAGRWRFDDNNFPTKIIIMDNAKNYVDELLLKAPIRSFDTQLKISKDIVCESGKAVYSYDMIMNRVSN